MTILKVQLNDEIRRITLDKTCFSLADLEAKVRLMFPQLVGFIMSFRDDDNNVIEIKTEEDLHLGCAQANARFPPIFRVLITETASPVPVPSPASSSVLSLAQDLLESLQEQTESEEGTTSSEDEVSIQGVCSDCSKKFSASAPRFKCMNCLEVVLCVSCELKSVHNPIHLLVKLRQPSSQLSLKQQLIFTSYIEDSNEKVIAKAQGKAIRRALRAADENSQKKKEERIKARKERIKRRTVARCKKLEESREKREKIRFKKTKASVESSETGLDSLEETSVQLVSPLIVVDPTPIISSVAVVVDPVKDASPQPVVEELDSKEEKVKEEHAVVNDILEAPAMEKELTESFVDIESSSGDSVEEEGSEQTWNVIVNGIKVIAGLNEAPAAPRSVDVRNYRIQGFSFARKLEEMEAMGFADKSRNIMVLMKHFSNLERAVEELTSSK